MLIAGEISHSFSRGHSLPQTSPFTPNSEQKIQPNTPQDDSEMCHFSTLFEVKLSVVFDVLAR